MLTFISPTAAIIAVGLSILFSLFMINRTVQVWLRLLPIRHGFVIYWEILYAIFIFGVAIVLFSYSLRTESLVHTYFEAGRNRITDIAESLSEYAENELFAGIESILETAQSSFTNILATIGTRIEKAQVQSAPSQIVHTTYPFTVASQTKPLKYEFTEVTIEDNSILFQFMIEPTTNTTFEWYGSTINQNSLFLYAQSDQQRYKLQDMGGVFNIDTELIQNSGKNFAWVRFDKPATLQFRLHYEDTDVVYLDLTALDQ